MWWNGYRTIVLDQLAQSFVDTHTTANASMEARWRGVEWLLARTPEVGTPRDKTAPKNFLIVVFDVTPLFLKLGVLYSYDDNNVFVHAATHFP